MDDICYRKLEKEKPALALSTSAYHEDAVS